MRNYFKGCGIAAAMVGAVVVWGWLMSLGGWVSVTTFLASFILGTGYLIKQDLDWS